MKQFTVNCHTCQKTFVCFEGFKLSNHKCFGEEKITSSVKPFREVKPGDIGWDYGDESGTVIAIGTYNQLKKYDSTGACYELDDDFKDEMVAVLDETQNQILYVYGADGFAVYI